METSGVRLERKIPDFVQSHERLRPLRDRVLVKPLPWEPSKTLTVIDLTRRTLRGTVVAVGPGSFPNRYNDDRSKKWQSKHFVPTTVKVGDLVELGGKEIDGYSFPEVMIGTERHILVQEADICGIVE